MYKAFIESLDRVGVKLPTWFFIVVAIILGLSIIIYISKKYTIPVFTKAVKIYKDVMSIDHIRETQNTAIEKSIKKDTELEFKITNIDTKLDSMVELLSKLQEHLSTQSTMQEAQGSALRVILANELDKRYRRYLELGYIPAGEFDEYCDMHDQYKALGGNHSGDEKFNYVMEHLERRV